MSGDGASPLREVMSRFATGITVLTTGGERCHGMTANSFNSVSLEPPLVLCCVVRTAVMHEAISVSGSFGVSVLAADQEHLARYFADRSRPRGAAQFDSVPCLPGRFTGAPLLTGALAWLECRLVAAYDGGDHSIFVGQVLGCGRGDGGEALLFFGGGFHQLLARPAEA
ncbi:flavin reductase family protein [Kutzneria kofuensis]|uniref:Flavin reductase (DIM6/NTAB) family NADH-FMN oxidoreductase RutF n=1 Tax=Kutzneria kofuensis TaxID=103725 RepID=A0A7W9NKR7_9PSEU|nr:flavin reductase (DIM6/NTAB) family NADH-FMN oxidoreductase RutF [Kutzneria kofuensis]